MKKYSVNLPIAGYVYIEVEAENEEEAIEKALEADIKIPDDLVEWDVFEKIVEGNVCYAPIWEAEVIEIEEEG